MMKLDGGEKHTREKKNTESGDFKLRGWQFVWQTKRPQNNPPVSCKTFLLVPRDQSRVMGVPVTPLCLFRIRRALHFRPLKHLLNALSSNLPAFQPNSHSLLYPLRSANWHLFVLTLPWSQRMHCQFFSHISVNKKVWVGLVFFFPSNFQSQ